VNKVAQCGGGFLMNRVTPQCLSLDASTRKEASVGMVTLDLMKINLKISR
jgi:hypothetical protein